MISRDPLPAPLVSSPCHAPCVAAPRICQADQRLTERSHMTQWLMKPFARGLCLRIHVAPRWRVGGRRWRLGEGTRPGQLVGGDWKISHHIGNVIIPTDFHIFQRGWNHQAVNVYSLRTWTWPSRNSGFSQLENGGSFHSYVNVYQRAFFLERRRWIWPWIWANFENWRCFWLGTKWRNGEHGSDQVGDKT